MQIMFRKTAQKNSLYWFPSDSDYELVFCEVDGMWCECGHNLAKYSDMLLSDYLLQMNIQIPDFTQFLRIITEDYVFEYRSYHGRVRVDYHERIFE